MDNETKVPENNVEVEELDNNALEEASGGAVSGDEEQLLDANGFMCNC